MARYNQRRCRKCAIWLDMSERRASKWQIDEGCSLCFSSYREATRPVEYRVPQKTIRRAITHGMNLERAALRKDILDMRQQLRDERREGQSLRQCARSIGLDPEDIWARYQKHDRCCESCEKHESVLGRRLFIDHCHITGTFRGFLCNTCNSGIGLLGDTAEAVAKALRYLEKISQESAL